MRCFHGTTSKGLHAILSKAGYKPNTPWTCSDNDGAMYVWPSNKIADMDLGEELTEDNQDEVSERGINQAFESAQVQAVTCNDFDLYVIELEIDDNLLSDDFSCENMDSVASYINIGDFDLTMVKAIYSFRMNQWLAPQLVAGLLHNQYFNKWSIEPALLEVAETLQQLEHYSDPEEFDYAEEYLPDLLLPYMVDE